MDLWNEKPIWFPKEAKEPIAEYNVGDEVIIKNEYDNGCGPLDYEGNFTNDMRRCFGGRVAKIVEKIAIYSKCNVRFPSPFYYKIDQDDGKYRWTQGMFVRLTPSRTGVAINDKKESCGNSEKSYIKIKKPILKLNFEL